jgi:glutaminyl-tRNA synthetase
MGIIYPIKVTLTNFTENEEIEVNLFPNNKELGTKKIHLTKTIYIDRGDFRDKEDKDFFGLTPGKEVGLKYAGYIICKEVKRDNSGNVTELECEYFKDQKKIPGRIHWVSDVDAVKVEVRLYDYLFKSENPSALENPLSDLNENSLIVRTDALVNKNILTDSKVGDKFQFERLAYFTVDKDTDFSQKRYVFNLTVGLGDEKNKKF